MSIEQLNSHSDLDTLIERLTSLREQLAEKGLDTVKVAHHDDSLDVLVNVEASIETVREFTTGQGRIDIVNQFNEGAPFANEQTIVYLY